ncbi:helix-turn-helix domain-containing protein [Flavobacterium rhizosphaerae]|uniref:Helix-turn-helix transcriptional regulator n=1 Tax=Flavobacterium rhizosphaerae TaxID=3163298 RepID=A0ABW8Z0K6_9FLAO
MRVFDNISELLHFSGLDAPSHPLIAVVDYSNIDFSYFDEEKICLNFYKISFRDTFMGKVPYGQGYYDFKEGGLAFLKPRQIVTAPHTSERQEGYALYFHQDFISGYPLGQAINQYGFFSYNVSEALLLSAAEKNIIASLFTGIMKELNHAIDGFTQDIVVSQVEQLLHYSKRFYNRQFITRKTVNNEIIAALDALLYSYFHEGKPLIQGLPSVSYVSEELKLSQRYLSDMLRTLTGLTTQQYIQDKVIEQAKNLLSTTTLTVAEIAYQMGFEHPQSFSKLFKVKTTLAPLAYRQTFN